MVELLLCACKLSESFNMHAPFIETQMMETPMRSILIPALVLMTTLAVPALASERCNVPQSDWRPVEDLKAALAAKGWTINNVKTEDGCYEVYGHDEAGKRVEIFFDPATFEAVGSDD